MSSRYSGELDEPSFDIACSLVVIGLLLPGGGLVASSSLLELPFFLHSGWLMKGFRLESYELPKSNANTVAGPQNRSCCFLSGLFLEPARVIFQVATTERGSYSRALRSMDAEGLVAFPGLWKRFLVL
jgi:hypothetical protein